MKVNTEQQQNKKANINILVNSGNRPRIHGHCVTSRAPRQLNISIEARLLKWFNVMHRKQTPKFTATSLKI